MKRLNVSIANTPYKQSQGLMFVKSMDEDAGMLFVFSSAQSLRFWGVNTYIPLDIAFVDSSGKIRQIEHIVPLSEKTVSCKIPCKYAIEANAGFFAAKRIEIGDKVTIHENGSHGYVEFEDQRRNIGRTGGNFTSRRIIAQLMDDDYAYGVDNVPEVQETEPNVPTLSQDDLWNYLEDNFDAPQEPEVNQDQMYPEQEEDIGEYPSQLPEKPEEEVEYPQFNNAFDASDWAQQNHEVMRISYTTQHGGSIVRDVEPHGQFFAETTSRQILVTYDETIGDIRAFVLMNIKSFAFTGDKFEPKFRIA